MTEQQDYALQANQELIAEVAKYYNDAIKNIEFYEKVNSASLQEMSRDHLLHWKNKLRSLIFNGMNCTDERSA